MNRNRSKARARRRPWWVREDGIIRPRDVAARGVSRVEIGRLVERGILRKLGRGLYVPVGIVPGVHHNLAQAAARVPRGVVCLLSALRFHELTTQNPSATWIAIGPSDWRSTTNDVPLRFVHMSGAAAKSDIEMHQIEGVAVQVFSAAKTVVDCFRYRNKIGMDVVLEALRAYRHRYRGDMDAVWRLTKICGVERAMTPHLESLT